MALVKATKIKQLVDSRTALLGTVIGLCDDEFDTVFGVNCESLRARLARIAVVDWARLDQVRQILSGVGQVSVDWSAAANVQEISAELIERRCCCSSAEILSEVVLSLQSLLAELRPLPEHHFLTSRGANETGGTNQSSVANEMNAQGVGLVVDALVRDAEQQCEEIRAWRFR